jgi:ATP synthase mitochondrial F1 complex assembly factor 1
MTREGHASISELREAYRPKAASVKKRMDTVPTRLAVHKLPKIGEKSTSASKLTPPPVTPVKTLSSYVDLDKLKQHKDPKEIELLWRAGHTKDNLLCAVIPTPIYQRMISLGRDHPMFILPLPRDSGVEMHFMEFKFPEPKVTHILFTSLLEYKTHGEYARPHTTIMHFEDLSNEQGIVLMRGEIDPNLNVVSQDESRLLVMHVQKLYGSDPESERGTIRRKLLQDFSKGSGDFNVNILMDELNRIE